MFSLKALALVLTVASLAQAHSPQKRETTVTFEGTYEDVRQLVINIVLAFTLATILVVIVAPIFGYKFDLIVSSLEDLDLGADPAVSSPELTGYAATGYSEPQPGTGQGYRKMPGSGSGLTASLSALGARVLNSIDLLDMAFNYMDIEDETCRMKTICQAENYAANHPVARLAINTLNSSLRGLEKYQHAVVAGQNGEDCSLLYDQCPFTYFGLEY